MTHSSTFPERLTLPEAAERARLSRDMIRDAIRAGHLRASQPNGKGGHIFITTADLDRWLNRPVAAEDLNTTPTFRLADGSVQGGGVMQPDGTPLGQPSDWVWSDKRGDYITALEAEFED